MKCQGLLSMPMRLAWIMGMDIVKKRPPYPLLNLVMKRGDSYHEPLQLCSHSCR